MHGLHLTADLYQCQGPQHLMLEAEAIAQLCLAEVHNAGLSCMADKWVSFPGRDGRPGGVTGTVLLAESHLAIHTWPESDSVTIDVYVCNFSGDNSAKAHALMDAVIAAYAPGKLLRQQLQRGELAK